MHRERRKVEIEDIDMAKMEEQSADFAGTALFRQR